MDTSTPKRQTDVRRRTVAPTTLQNLLAASSGAQSAVNDLKSDEALDKLEEELNRRVDEETQVLVQGMADLVGMSVLGNKDHFRVAQESFQAECRAESMIRASHSLLSLSHTLKLLHLFADSATPASVLERLSSSLASDIAALKLTASGPSNAYLTPNAMD